MTRRDWTKFFIRLGFDKELISKRESCFRGHGWVIKMKRTEHDLCLDFSFFRKAVLRASIEFYSPTNTTLKYSTSKHKKRTKKSVKNIENEIKSAIKVIVKPTLAPILMGLDWTALLMEEALKSE
jgi:hypothetical protein